MSYEELSKSVKLSEGFRNKIYQDTEGFDTIGGGHKVVPADNFVAGKEYTEEDLPETAQHVLSEMCFQLGQSGVSKFKNMWKALQEANFIGASYEMLDSRWNKQTPNRCKKLADLMKSCG